MPSFSCKCLSTAVCCFSTLVATAGWGHGGGAPRASQIVFAPDDPQHVLVASPVWGMFDSRDGGASWRYACSEAFGGVSLQPHRYSAVMARSGRILVGSRNNAGLASTDDGCNWRTSTIEGEDPISSLVLDRDDQSVLALTVKLIDGGLSSKLWRSNDRGDTWQAQGGPLPPGFVGALVVPRTPGAVIYTFGQTSGTDSPSIYWSDDSGVHWVPTAVPSTDTIDALVAHPVREGVLLVTSSGMDANGVQIAAGKMWLSIDAGSSWTQVAEMDGTLTQSAFSPDGDMVLAGGSNGLFRAPLKDLEAVPATPLELLRQIPIWGLHWDATGLYTGDDEFFSEGNPGAMVSRSSDGGRTFLPLMRSCAVTFPTCNVDSTSYLRCGDPWAEPGGYKDHFVTPATCEKTVAIPIVNTESIDPSQARSDAAGCACSTLHSRRGIPLVRFAVAAWLGLTILRRRARGL